MNPLDTPLHKSTNEASTQTTSYARVTPQSVSQVIASALSEFTQGQRITGTISDIINKDVKILIGDATILQARIEDSIPLSIGQRAIFEVTHADQAQITLRLLSDPQADTQNILIDKALTAAGLPNNERYSSVVRELLNQNLSIDKSSIHKLLQQSITFKNASISTLAVMNKYNIDVNPVNTTQFEAYRNFEHRIVQQVNTL